MANPIVSFEKKRKRNHDIAYLTVLLALSLGILLFVTFYVNSLLRTLPILP
jgi:hypothetical protein